MDKDRAIAVLKDMQSTIDSNRNTIKNLHSRNQLLEISVKMLSEFIDEVREINPPDESN